MESFGAAGRLYPGTEGENVELLATCSTTAEFRKLELHLGLGFLFKLPFILKTHLFKLVNMLLK